ncbi:hypothetical protein ES332_A07G268400v1 [Gossypium tomentosum]|uniref:Uncharacterized protein n=1 Tax=Gossypium tomentosum TaxID=34277 RepID=A0A5D2PYI9_GOSTO|nr:hypothetical protein ES332_A07G268400v1 [Gossypium tomentosum]
MPFSSQLRTSFFPLNLQFLPSCSESKPQKNVCGATTPWIGSGGGSGDLWVYQTWKGNNIRFSFFYYLIPFSRGKRVNVKEDELGELTPKTSTADEMGDHAGIHPRRSN